MLQSPSAISQLIAKKIMSTRKIVHYAANQPHSFNYRDCQFRKHLQKFHQNISAKPLTSGQNQNMINLQYQILQWTQLNTLIKVYTIETSIKPTQM